MNRIRLSFVTAAVAAVLTGTCWAQGSRALYDAPLFTSFFEASARVANRGDYVQGDLFLPTFQSDHQMLFLDIRGNWTDPKIYEGNFGLGYRGILESGWVFGSYIYYDRMRSPNKHYFSQATVGLEMMNVDWDFRVNAYLPETSGRAIAAPVADFQSGTIFVSTDEELAYQGVDLEVGYLLADSEEGDMELRVFGTGYYFDRENPGYRQIAGGRARMELRLYDLDWLGEGSRVMLGADYQYDDVREESVGALFSVRVPLGSERRHRPDRLQRRMLSPVVRDINVVTMEGTRIERAKDPETNARIGLATLIDSDSIDPAADVAFAPEGGLILVDGDVTLSESLILKDGQTLRGAGFDVIGVQSGRRVTFGTPANVAFTDPGQDAILLANDVRVRDLTLDGGRSNFFGTDATEVHLHNNVLTGSVQTSIQLSGSSSGTIENNVIGNGIAADSFFGTIDSNNITPHLTSGISVSTLSGTISNNQIVGNTETGISVGSLFGGTIDGNSFAGDVTDAGIGVSTVSNGTISNNALNVTTGDGVEIGTMVNGTVSGNAVIGTPNNGYVINDMSGGDVNNNSVFGATSDGFLISSMTGGVFQDNSSIVNGGNGYRFVSIIHTGDDPVVGNLAVNNGGTGFLFDSADIDTFARIRDNQSLGNAVGFDFVDLPDGGVTISSNIAQGNFGDGFIVRSSGGTFTSSSSFEGNTSSFNGGNGFNKPASDRIRYSNNTANSNAGFGFLIGDQDTFFTDNSADSNGAGGFSLVSATSFFDRNTATNNTGVGIDIGSSFAFLTSNVATGNTSDGIRIGTVPFGTRVRNNSSTNNLGNGIVIGTLEGELTGSVANDNRFDGFKISNLATIFNSDGVLGNSANNNLDDGFDIDNWSSGAVSNNTSTGNFSDGYEITNRTGGVANGNTAIGNGNNTLP